MSRVLFVSKPVAPPWNDSSKNLAWDLARSLRAHTPVVMSSAGVALALERGEVEAVYRAGPSSFSGGMAQNARVFKRLVFGRRTDLWHFFFAPNRKSSTMGRWASRTRRVPTVHTVCSAPRDDANLRSILFADRTVVLSARTEARLLNAGIARDRVARIAPCVAPLTVPDDAERRRTRDALGLPRNEFLVLFPGDLEFGSGAELVIEATARLPKDSCLALACRRKTARSIDRERELRDLVVQLGLDRRVFWIGETPQIHALLAAADVVALPTDTLYAKMDYPLVLLEAMSLGRVVIVSRGTSAAELAEGGAAWVVDEGPEALAATLREAMDRVNAFETGKRARTRVVDAFSPEGMAKAYEALYEGLLGSSA